MKIDDEGYWDCEYDWDGNPIEIDEEDEILEALIDALIDVSDL